MFFFFFFLQCLFHKITFILCIAASACMCIKYNGPLAISAKLFFCFKFHSLIPKIPACLLGKLYATLTKFTSQFLPDGRQNSDEFNFFSTCVLSHLPTIQKCESKNIVSAYLFLTTYNCSFIMFQHYIVLLQAFSCHNSAYKKSWGLYVKIPMK